MPPSKAEVVPSDPHRRYVWVVSRAGDTCVAMTRGEAMLALVGLLLHVAVGPDSCATVSLLPAYAHNDYRNRRPLSDALELGYRGVEADVFRVGNELRVGHKRSEARAPNTLSRLYLEPLRARQFVCGYVLADRAPFFLNIEIKEPDSAAFSLLLAELNKYPELLPALRVTMVGWWPKPVPGGKPWPPYIRHQLVVQRGALTLPADSASIGLISIDYGKVLRWRGSGAIPPADSASISRARDLAAIMGVPLRVHHAPDDGRVYKWLLKEGVTLLGATNLERTRSLLSTRD